LNKDGLVVDASLVVDLFSAKDEARALMAEKVLECVKRRKINVYAPRLFLAEVAGVLVRYLMPSNVERVVDALSSEVILVGDEAYFKVSIEIALATGSRGADSYYLGLAKILNLPLATSDKVQAQNAKKAGIRSFYILNNNELEELMKYMDCR
jgi:predicted nucleic acid-binding protein